MCDRCGLPDSPGDPCRRCGAPAALMGAGGLLLCFACGARQSLLRKLAPRVIGEFEAADKHPELADLVAWYATAAPFLQQ